MECYENYYMDYAYNKTPEKLHRNQFNMFGTKFHRDLEIGSMQTEFICRYVVSVVPCSNQLYTFKINSYDPNVILIL